LDEPENCSKNCRNDRQQIFGRKVWSEGVETGMEGRKK
jgi:hypothetical protein